MNKQIVFTLLIIFISCQSFSQDERINKSHIQSAEKLFGLEFIDAERDSMLDDLNSQLSDFKSLRKINIPNSVPPSIMFNPIPLGFETEESIDHVEFSDYSEAVMPDDKNELAFYSIGQLAHLLRSKQITSVELTSFFLERLKKFDKALHCVITFTEESTLR